MSNVIAHIGAMPKPFGTTTALSSSDISFLLPSSALAFLLSYRGFFLIRSVIGAPEPHIESPLHEIRHLIVRVAPQNSRNLQLQVRLLETLLAARYIQPDQNQAKDLTPGQICP